MMMLFFGKSLRKKVSFFELKMKKQGSEHGGKHESRFPWVFKTEGSLQYFGKINRRVIYFSSKEVDIKLISEDIQTSPLLAVAADVWQNKVVRVLTICSKKSVFVISLNVGYVISSLSSFLSSLNSKIIVGYGLDSALSILKKVFPKKKVAFFEFLKLVNLKNN